MPTWTIARMAPRQAERVRAIRLRALADSPDAFGTTYAEDSTRPIAEWPAWVGSDDKATFVASDLEADVGLVVGKPYEEAPNAAELCAMWVAPESRGRGVGAALVDAVVGWARGRGFRRVLLDVADENVPAIGLYASKGFVPTGTKGSLPPPREHIREHQRVLVL